jgi:(E)-4-hydroxy-3-methylbut-2-enyl-diphosphate synthase
VNNIGGHQVPVVIADYRSKESITPASLYPVGYNYSASLDKWNLGDQACDYVFCGNRIIDFEIPGTLGLIYNSDTWTKLDKRIRCYPLFDGHAYFEAAETDSTLNFVSLDIDTLFDGKGFLEKIRNDRTVVIVADTSNEHGMAEQRRLFIELMLQDISCPVIVRRKYSALNADLLQLHSATDFGALFLEGMGDGIWMEAFGVASEKAINTTSFGILQATRTRISKTEYISCPSCGRTLFDLQETTAKIRARTDHLKGLKIGIMGCIVNGPGEMADADYGYVGVGPGKITLYKGKEVIKRNIDSAIAVDELIELIKSHGDWIEKSNG